VSAGTPIVVGHSRNAMRQNLALFRQSEFVRRPIMTTRVHAECV
jgi:hypothetical protein